MDPLEAVTTSPCATCRRDIEVRSLSGPQLRHLLDYSECPRCVRARLKGEAQPAPQLARVTWGEDSSEMTAVYAADWLAECVRSYIENDLIARQLETATISRDGETWQVAVRVRAKSAEVVISFVREDNAVKRGPWYCQACGAMTEDAAGRRTECPCDVANRTTERGA